MVLECIPHLYFYRRNNGAILVMTWLPQAIHVDLVLPSFVSMPGLLFDQIDKGCQEVMRVAHSCCESQDIQMLS